MARMGHSKTESVERRLGEAERGAQLLEGELKSAIAMVQGFQKTHPDIAEELGVQSHLVKIGISSARDAIKNLTKGLESYDETYISVDALT